MNKDEIKKIADLARLDIKDVESEKLAGEIDSILGYVEQINQAPIADDNARVENAGVRNVMRENENPHPTGDHTKDLLKEAPETEDSLVKVKKIL